MEKLILGVDIGTTSLKAAVFDLQGVQLASAVVEYTLLTPELNVVEAPCGVYLDSLKKCLDIIRGKGTVDTQNICVIGFSVQGETLCFLDHDGAPLRNAIVWMDNRASDQAEQLRAQFGDELCYQVTGQVSFEACWPAAKILWVREHEPELFARTAHFALLEDYFIYQLTGRLVAEGSLLTSTEYWDIRTKRYWPEMLAFLGIAESRLPEIRVFGDLVGNIVRVMCVEL